MINSIYFSFKYVLTYERNFFFNKNNCKIVLHIIKKKILNLIFREDAAIF